MGSINNQLPSQIKEVGGMRGVVTNQEAPSSSCPEETEKKNGKKRLRQVKQWLLLKKLAWMLLTVAVFSELDGISLVRRMTKNSTEGFLSGQHVFTILFFWL